MADLKNKLINLGFKKDHIDRALQSGLDNFDKCIDFLTNMVEFDLKYKKNNFNKIKEVAKEKIESFKGFPKTEVRSKK